jgi:uncharacterized protein YcnI
MTQMLVQQPGKHEALSSESKKYKKPLPKYFDTSLVLEILNDNSKEKNLIFKVKSKCDKTEVVVEVTDYCSFKHSL